jgi:hypothetical protein
MLTTMGRRVKKLEDRSWKIEGNISNLPPLHPSNKVAIP